MKNCIGIPKYQNLHLFSIKWVCLNQRFNETCNNDRNCKMITTSPLPFTKNVVEEEQPKGAHPTLKT
jgi:hypothetical protein